MDYPGDAPDGLPAPVIEGPVLAPASNGRLFRHRQTVLRVESRAHDFILYPRRTAARIRGTHG